MGDHTTRGDAEAAIKRNPHPDFGETQASRPDWDTDTTFSYTKTRDPNWQWGSGATDGGESLKKNHISIDPYAEGRSHILNYKLLISGIVPRPIGFISTQSADGKSMNLAPFSFTQVFSHDPPIFCVGFSGGFDNAKDSLKNLAETGECVINMVSEHFIEAANATSVNSPYGISEWALTGLHPAPCENVKPSRVKEAIFSVEAKLLETKEFESRSRPGVKTSVLAIVEGVRFWVREDAIDETGSLIDPAIFRPMARLGGIGYARVTTGMELLRPKWDEDVVAKGKEGLANGKVQGQL